MFSFFSGGKSSVYNSDTEDGSTDKLLQHNNTNDEIETTTIISPNNKSDSSSQIKRRGGANRISNNTNEEIEPLLQSSNDSTHSTRSSSSNNNHASSDLESNTSGGTDNAATSGVSNINISTSSAIMSGDDGSTTTPFSPDTQKKMIGPTSSSSSSPSIITGSGADGSSNNNSNTKSALKLLFGAGGIYASFLYYGSLQEDVFNYISKTDGTSKFHYAWFLQFLEALANIVVALIGREVAGGTKGLPLKQFYITGASQVCSKACTSLALACGLSFPVATLAKSGKMAPVMIGQLLIGGAKYNLRDYLQVLAIIGGTVLLSLGKKKAKPGQHDSFLGVFFILMSLAMDGVTGGIQKKLKSDLKKIGMNPKPYDFMLHTNFSMCVVALMISIIYNNEFYNGYMFCINEPIILDYIIRFSCCSAIGQSFIFYTVANFDPLVCSTVTTTRKIFSVLLSIFMKGHSLSGQGWAGVSLAISGILSEIHEKVTRASSTTTTTPSRSKASIKSKNSDIM